MTANFHPNSQLPTLVSNPFDQILHVLLFVHLFCIAIKTCPKQGGLGLHYETTNLLVCLW